MFRTVPAPSDDPSPAVVDRLVTAAASDPAATISTVIVLAVLAAAVVVALIVWLRMRATARARRLASPAGGQASADRSPAERERREAQLEYRERIAAAERALEAATRDRSDRLRVSELALALALDARHPQAIARAQASLEAERANTGPVDAARDLLHHVTLDTARLDAATRPLEAERSQKAADAEPDSGAETGLDATR